MAKSHSDQLSKLHKHVDGLEAEIPYLIKTVKRTLLVARLILVGPVIIGETVSFCICL